MTTYLPRPDVVVARRRVGVRAARPARSGHRRRPRRPDRRLGARSRCRAAGRCRDTTARSTRTCRCRSPVPPPRVPDDNPTGRVPPHGRPCRPTWRGQRIVLHVGGGGVGALRARERRAGRHGQGLPPPARVRPHRRRRARPALRARAHGREVVGRDLPRGPGPLVPRRPAPHRSSSTRRRRCTSPTCTPSPTTTPTPATGRLARPRRGRRAGIGRDGWTRASASAAASRRRARALRAPDQLGRQLLAVRGTRRRRVAARARRRAVDRRDAEPPRPHRHARSTPTATRSTPCRSTSASGEWRSAGTSCSSTAGRC